MDIERELMFDIAEHPNDQTPWLVLSDWMEDHGQLERATLLRTANWLRQHLTSPDRLVHEQRLRDLIQSVGALPLLTKRLSLNSVVLDLVLIPPGSFCMGSPPEESRRDPDEGPVHIVSLSKAFWMGIYPVTQEQWHRVTGSPYRGRFRGPRRPVQGVSWIDCQKFLTLLSERCKVHARLPTEAEWEYACRAGTSSAFYFGDSLTSHLANFDGNYPYGCGVHGPWKEETTDVGHYPTNAWGLYDMHGNVWEWCQDWHEEMYYEQSPGVDPKGPESGNLRVLRGGSWYSYSWSCRSAGREKFVPESDAGNYGFRVVVDL